MSFLSSLFCCFDSEDSAKLRSQHNSTISKIPSNASRPNLTKTHTNLQKALNQSSPSTPRLANTRNNSNANLNSLNHSNTKLNSTKNLDKNINININTNSNNDKDNNMINNNNKLDNSDYKEIIEELSDAKESANSSKVDDDILIHENDTQNTDDNQQINSQFNDDSNPISNLNPNDVQTKSTFAYDDQLFNEQFGVDLKQILPDQAVSSSGWLLDTKKEQFKNKKCLVLDLDETLVHSSFKFVRQCDFVIPVEIENQIHNVYVIKRPGVDKFLKRVGEIFEVVVFTASVSRYGDPLLDILDPQHKNIHHRLFRDSCYNYQGNYIKNLSQMGRPLEDLIIIDNSPASYVFHPQHAVPISSWFSDSHDCELSDLLPFLEDLATDNVDDVRLVLDINI